MNEKSIFEKFEVEKLWKLIMLRELFSVNATDRQRTIRRVINGGNFFDHFCSHKGFRKKTLYTNQLL
jgi:hypothetical protein